jgi:hypothetical protein
MNGLGDRETRVTMAVTENRSEKVKVAESESIIVRGARVHNLKNIDFEIPRRMRGNFWSALRSPTLT